MYRPGFNSVVQMNPDCFSAASRFQMLQRRNHGLGLAITDATQKTPSVLKLWVLKEREGVGDNGGKKNGAPQTERKKARDQNTQLEQFVQSKIYVVPYTQTWTLRFIDVPLIQHSEIQ